MAEKLYLVKSLDHVHGDVVTASHWLAQSKEDAVAIAKSSMALTKDAIWEKAFPGTRKPHQDLLFWKATVSKADPAKMALNY